MTSVYVLKEAKKETNNIQSFVKELESQGWLGIKNSDKETIFEDGPSDPWFNAAWHRILNEAYKLDSMNQEWKLHHVGHLFAWCPASITQKEKEILFQ